MRRKKTIFSTPGAEEDYVILDIILYQWRLERKNTLELVNFCPSTLNQL